MKKIISLIKQQAYFLGGLFACIALYICTVQTNYNEWIIMIASVIAIVAASISFWRNSGKDNYFISTRFHVISVLSAAGVFLFSNIFFFGENLRDVPNVISIMINMLFQLLLGIIRMPFSADKGVVVYSYGSFPYFVVHFIVVYIAFGMLLRHGKILSTCMKAKKAECNV